MRKIQLKGVLNPDVSCMIHSTLFVSILIRIIFDTTRLFDVTFLLRNIIVTLKVRQKNHLGKFRDGFTF